MSHYLTNFIENYSSYAEEITDAPSVFHKYVAYSLLSAAIGNKIFFNFGDLRIYPNLWILLMAPSSLYRKSTAIGIGARILSSTNLKIILPNEFTQERLVETLSQQPQGLFVFYEFMTLASSLDKDYMISAKSFLTELFDSPLVYTRQTKAETLEIKNPCISIMAATTQDWFLERIKERDLYGGFLTRFIFIPTTTKEKSLSFPPEADINKKNALCFYLSQLYEHKCQAIFSEGALKLQDEWYKEHCVESASKNSGLIGSFINRMQIYILKLSVLEEASRDFTPNPLIVSEESMNSAIQTSTFLIQNIKKLCSEELTFDKFQGSRKKILDIIKAKKDVTRSELLTSTRMPSRELNEIVNTLKEEDAILEIDEDREGNVGRKKTRYVIRE